MVGNDITVKLIAVTGHKNSKRTADRLKSVRKERTNLAESLGEDVLIILTGQPDITLPEISDRLKPHIRQYKERSLY